MQASLNAPEGMEGYLPFSTALIATGILFMAGLLAMALLLSKTYDVEQTLVSMRLDEDEH